MYFFTIVWGECHRGLFKTVGFGIQFLFLGLMTSFTSYKTLTFQGFITECMGFIQMQRRDFTAPEWNCLYYLLYYLYLLHLLPSRGRELFKSPVKIAGVPKAPAHSRDRLYSISSRLLQITFQCIKLDFH